MAQTLNSPCKAKWVIKWIGNDTFALQIAIGGSVNNHVDGRCGIHLGLNHHSNTLTKYHLSHPLMPILAQSEITVWDSTGMPQSKYHILQVTTIKRVSEIQNAGENNKKSQNLKWMNEWMNKTLPEVCCIQWMPEGCASSLGRDGDAPCHATPCRLGTQRWPPLLLGKHGDDGSNLICWL